MPAGHLLQETYRFLPTRSSSRLVDAVNSYLCTIMFTVSFSQDWEMNKNAKSQVGSRFLLQRVAVKLTEAHLVPDLLVETFGEAIAEWNKTLEGPVAASALELRVGEQRIEHHVNV